MSDYSDIDNEEHHSALHCSDLELLPGLFGGNVYNNEYSDSTERDSVELSDIIHPFEMTDAETPPHFLNDAADPSPGPGFSSQPGFDEGLNLSDLDKDRDRGTPETDASVSSQDEDEVYVGPQTLSEDESGPSQVLESDAENDCDKTIQDTPRCDGMNFDQQTMRNDNHETSVEEPTAGPSTSCSSRPVNKAQSSATTTMDVDEDRRVASTVQKALSSDFAQLEGTVVSSNCLNASNEFTLAGAFENISELKKFPEFELPLSSATGSKIGEGDTATDTSTGKSVSMHEPLKHARERSKRMQTNSCNSPGPGESGHKKRKVKTDKVVELKVDSKKLNEKTNQKHDTDKQCHDTFNRRSATVVKACAEIDGNTGSKSFFKSMFESPRTGKIFVRTYGEDFDLPGGGTTSAEPGAGSHRTKTNNRNRKPSTVTSNPNQNSDDGANVVNCTACHGNTQKVQLLQVQTPGHTLESQDCQEINSEWVQCQAEGGCLNRIHVYCLGFPSKANIPADYKCLTCLRIR